MQTNEQTSAINHLLSIFQSELKIYNKIEEIEQQKCSILKKGQLADMSSFNQKLEDLIQQSIEMEDQRNAAQKKVIDLLELPEINHLKEFIPMLPEEFHEDFLTTYTVFMNKLQSIKAINELNDRLLKESLRVIDFTLDLVSGENESLLTDYSDGGQKQKRAVKSLIFDKRV